jgi:glycosyltransferase involved in cell wall biosynthesis
MNNDWTIIAVLICTYNAENYIQATLDSVLHQTYKDNRVVLIQSKENIWPYKWLNKLLDIVDEKFVAIQDHDDLWHPQKIELQLRFLKQHEQYHACGTISLVYFENKKLYTPWKFPDMSYYCPHTTLMFRNNKSYRYDTSMLFLSDSYSMRYNLCNNEKKIINLQLPLTLHLIKSNNSNLSSHRFSINKNNIIRLFQVMWVSFHSFSSLLFEIMKYYCTRILWSSISKWFIKIVMKYISNRSRELNKEQRKYMLELIWIYKLVYAK